MTAMTKRMLLAVALVAGGSGSPAFADLIVDGGFEPPSPTTVQNQSNGGYIDFFVGDSFGGPNNNAWTVVQKGGGVTPVAVTPTTEWTSFPYPKTYYNGHSGLQWLDLTADYDSGQVIGVQQSMATTLGGQYLLSFYVGSFNSNPASVEVDINGASVGTFTNSLSTTFPAYNGDGVAGSTWKLFSYAFTAMGTSTTVAFFNRVGPGVLVNGLDDVEVVQSVPEPSPFVSAGSGIVFASLVCAWRRRRGGKAHLSPPRR